MVFNFFVQAQTRDWGDCVVGGIPTIKCFEVIAGNLLSVVSGIFILALLIMFIVGSLRLITSGGSPEKLKSAKGTLTYAILGFILFISSYLILNIIQTLFLGNTPGGPSLFKFEIP